MWRWPNLSQLLYTGSHICSFYAFFLKAYLLTTMEVDFYSDVWINLIYTHLLAVSIQCANGFIFGAVSLFHFIFKHDDHSLFFTL